MCDDALKRRLSVYSGVLRSRCRVRVMGHVIWEERLDGRGGIVHE